MGNALVWTHFCSARKTGLAATSPRFAQPNGEVAEIQGGLNRSMQHHLI